MSFHGKMTPEHFEILRLASLAWLERHPLRHYVALGLSDERHRWDMFWHACEHSKKLHGCFCADLYEYLNDSHIDTALRYIVRTHSSCES